jgi:UDP-2,3-diacylglucosamine hydrolase
MNSAGAGGEGPLAIFCGGGSLPLAVADFVAKRGRKVILFPVRGAADPAAVSCYPHHWLYLGELGKFQRLAKAAGCRDVVFIGSLVRPAFWQMRPDFDLLMLLPRILAAFRGGDNFLLSSVGKLVEERGFRLLGAHQVAPEILVPEGVLGRVPPSQHDRADIALGLDYLRAASRFDIGQAVALSDRYVLAVEAAEGTDQMLARVAEMRGRGRVAPGRGVLVKAPKEMQDHRFDLPSIGPQTIEGVARAGLAGIAVVAGATIIAEPAKVVSAADHANVFVVGVPGTAP